MCTTEGKADQSFHRSAWSSSSHRVQLSHQAIHPRPPAVHNQHSVQGQGECQVGCCLGRLPGCNCHGVSGRRQHRGWQVVLLREAYRLRGVVGSSTVAPDSWAWLLPTLLGDILQSQLLRAPPGSCGTTASASNQQTNAPHLLHVVQGQLRNQLLLHGTVAARKRGRHRPQPALHEARKAALAVHLRDMRADTVTRCEMD